MSSIRSSILEIISTVESDFPSDWETAFVCCFHDGDMDEKDTFKMIVNHRESEEESKEEGAEEAEKAEEAELQLNEKVQELLTALRKECWSQGEKWQMAVFGFDRAGRVNVYLGDKSEDNCDNWIEKAEM